MNNNWSQNFSQLYYQSQHLNYFEYSFNAKKVEDCVAHPFADIEDVYRKISSIRGLDSYEEGLKFFQLLQETQTRCLHRFEFEACAIVEGKTKYVNDVVDLLIPAFEKFKFYRFQLTKHYPGRRIRSSAVSTFISILFNAYSSILRHIHINYKIELNRRNRDYLNNLKISDEPVLSFYLISKIEKQHFENIYKKYLVGALVSDATDFSTFKALFENKVMENRINWIGTKSSLVFFVREMILKKIVSNPKNQHWKIISEFVVLRGEVISQKELLNQQAPKKSDQLRILRFLKAMSPQH